MPRYQCPPCRKTYLMPGAPTACPDCGGGLTAMAEAVADSGSRQDTVVPSGRGGADSGAAATRAGGADRAGAPSSVRETLPVQPAASPATHADVTLRAQAPRDPSAIPRRATALDATLQAPRPAPVAAAGTDATLKLGGSNAGDINVGATLRAPSTGGGDSRQAETLQQSEGPAAAATSGTARRSAQPEGTPFGRYNLISALGAGGMGVVWKAWDTELRRMVALKQIKYQETSDEETIKRFLREARVAAKLRHTNIIGVHDVGDVDGRHYITMDYVDGQTMNVFLDATADLKRQASRKGMNRLRHEIRILADIALAVAYAHREGIVHRDIKPSNVLIDREERPWVMDFGLAKEVGTGEGGEGRRVAMTQMTLGGQMLGTPAYMSPEQAAGDSVKIGPRTDVWALGVVLYEVLTGRLPFDGKNTWEILSATTQGDVKPPRRWNRHVPVELEAVCLKALQRNLDQRYEGADAFAEELQRWLRGDAVLAKAPTLAFYVWRWLSRRRARVLSSLGAAVLLSAALGWAWREHVIGDERTREMLEESVVAVQRFEDQLLRTELNPDARVVMAKLPLNLLDRMVLDDAGNGPALAWRGQVKRLLGRSADAEQDFDTACEQTPEEAEVWFVRGLYWLDRLALSRGLPGFERASGGARVTAAREDTTEERGWRERGLGDLVRMTEASQQRERTRSAELRIGRATAALFRGDPAQALEILHAVPGPRAARLRAWAHYTQGDFDAAAACFWEVLDNWPQDLASWRHAWLAREAAAVANEGRDEARVRELEQGVEAVDARIRSGEEQRLRELQEDKDKSAGRGGRERSELFHAYVRRAVLRLDLAELQIRSGRDAGELLGWVIEDCGRVLDQLAGERRIAEMTVPLLLRARAELRLGRIAGDIDILEKAWRDGTQILSTERNQNLGEAYDLRGLALWHYGDLLLAGKQDPRDLHERAAKDLEAAVQRGFAGAHASRAEFLRARGKADEALTAYAEAERAMPWRTAELQARAQSLRDEKK